MSLEVHGPGKPYELLFDDDTSEGMALPDAFREIYGGEWRLPEPGQLPYSFINFVMSRDGRVSFNIPGHDGGGDISRGLRHDTWLMALLRARADAVLVGASTLRASLKHHWTPQAVFPADKEAFAALRAHEGRSPAPILVLVTRGGDLPLEAVVLRAPVQQLIIATTAAGAERAQQALGQQTQISYHVSPGDQVDMLALAQTLRADHGVATLLSEGGAQVYGAMIRAGVIQEEFLTVSPIVVGNPAPPAAPRTSLVEGVAFGFEQPPEVTLLSLRRYGSYLFQRSRYLVN